MNIGEKINTLRLKKKLSTKDLAKKAGISAGMLSLLEKGSTQGSVETLRKVAKVLDITLSYLFEEEDQELIGVDHESFHIVRKDNRKKIFFANPAYTCELLTPDLKGEIEFVLVELGPEHIPDEIFPPCKSGEECNLVLQGEIEVQLDDKTYTLYEGDCIRFNPKIPHKINNRRKKKALYISARL
ncbi:MAG: XRE family transcriptional regulator [Sulfurospirillaceae bacterium]|nr:XRE family transcriptional regulator [Sulfurospirillaceae bacterium]